MTNAELDIISAYIIYNETQDKGIKCLRNPTPQTGIKIHEWREQTSHLAEPQFLLVLHTKDTVTQTRDIVQMNMYKKITEKFLLEILFLQL